MIHEFHQFHLFGRLGVLSAESRAQVTDRVRAVALLIRLARWTQGNWNSGGRWGEGRRSVQGKTGENGVAWEGVGGGDPCSERLQA